MHLREAYRGLTDVQLRVRAANALGRALLFTSSPAEGAAVARQAARELPPEMADDALAPGGLRADGRAVRRARRRGAGVRDAVSAASRCGPSGRRSMGAIAALEWNQSGGHVDEVVALSLRALAGGELQRAPTRTC